MYAPGICMNSTGSEMLCYCVRGALRFGEMSFWIKEFAKTL